MLCFVTGDRKNLENKENYLKNSEFLFFSLGKFSFSSHSINLFIICILSFLVHIFLSES